MILPQQLEHIPPQTADTATKVSVIREGCSSVCSRGSGASSLPFIYIHHEQKQQMPGYTYVFGYAKHTK